MAESVPTMDNSDEEEFYEVPDSVPELYREEGERTPPTSQSEYVPPPGEEAVLNAKSKASQSVTEPNPPVQITVYEVSSESLSLRWDAPAGEVERYIVTCCHEGDVVQESTDTNNLTLSNLKPGVCYSLLVSTQLRNGRISKPAVTSAQTRSSRNNDEELKIVMVGKTGIGKSATGNTILGRQYFESKFSAESMTVDCSRGKTTVDGQKVAVIDTPGLFDTRYGVEKTTKDMTQCITYAAPGPHVFLVVIRLGRYTDEEMQTVQKIKEIFGQAADKYSMVLFTHGDQLEDTIEDFLKGCSDLKELVDRCNGQYHVFNNKLKDHSQVTELLQKIRHVVQKNGGSHYTNEMFQEAERAVEEEKQRILKKKEGKIRKEIEEVERKLQEKYEQEMKKMNEQLQAERERERKERQEEMKRERECINEESKREREERERERKRDREEQEKEMANMKNTMKEQYERELREGRELVQSKHEDKAREEAEGVNPLLRLVVAGETLVEGGAMLVKGAAQLGRAIVSWFI